MMSGFLWEDDNSFSGVNVKMEPLDDVDGVYSGSAFGEFIFNSPIKAEPQWLENSSKAVENTSFDSGYTSSSQDILNQQGLSIDPDFVRENSKFIGTNKTFAKIERGGRLSGMNAHHWSPIKLNSQDDFSAFTLETNFLFEPDTGMSSDPDDAHDIVAEQSIKNKRKYATAKRRKPYTKKQTAKGRKTDNIPGAPKPSKKLNAARSKFTTALENADEVSIARHQKHMENIEVIKITKEQTARAAHILNRSHDSNINRKVRRVIFQENQKLQGERFTWSVGNSINKSFKHISVKKGLKRKRGVTAAQARRQALMDGSESD